MPQVIDVPEVIQEERWQPYEEKTAPLPLSTQPRRRRGGFLASLWSAVVSMSERYVRPQPRMVHSKQPFELPIDRIAREHPFLFIKAMSG
jgi:hypothetical protein